MSRRGGTRYSGRGYPPAHLFSVQERDLAWGGGTSGGLYQVRHEGASGAGSGLDRGVKGRARSHLTVALLHTVHNVIVLLESNTGFRQQATGQRRTGLHASGSHEPHGNGRLGMAKPLVFTSPLQGLAPGAQCRGQMPSLSQRAAAWGGRGSRLPQGGSDITRQGRGRKRGGAAVTRQGRGAQTTHAHAAHITPPLPRPSDIPHTGTYITAVASLTPPFPSPPLSHLKTIINDR